MFSVTPSLLMVVIHMAFNAFGGKGRGGGACGAG